MKYYCTYFDRNYLVKGLTLYRSMERWCGEFVLWVLCFDNATYKILRSLALPSLRPLPLAEFEKDEAPLSIMKANCIKHLVHGALRHPRSALESAIMRKKKRGVSHG